MEYISLLFSVGMFKKLNILSINKTFFSEKCIAFVIFALIISNDEFDVIFIYGCGVIIFIICISVYGIIGSLKESMCLILWVSSSELNWKLIESGFEFLKILKLDWKSIIVLWYNAAYIYSPVV